MALSSWMVPVLAGTSLYGPIFMDGSCYEVSSRAPGEELIGILSVYSLPRRPLGSDSSPWCTLLLLLSSVLPLPSQAKVMPLVPDSMLPLGVSSLLHRSYVEPLLYKCSCLRSTLL
jgi:hypothetical protein